MIKDKPRAAADFRIVLCFFAVYVIWGSTYLAIRFTVADLPPVLAAGIRFAVAGTALFLWSRANGEPMPDKAQWRNVALISAMMFLIAYSGVFWAETRIPSGIAAVLVATVPIWTCLLEVFVLRESGWKWSMAGSILLGFGGVVLLTLNSGGGKLDLLACGAVLLSNMSWAAGSVISKRLNLPSSKLLLAGCEMMIGGLMLLLFSLPLGEMAVPPHFTLKSALALLYLIVFGSLLAFTAFVWLLGRLSATSVASYAYVNPVVALLLGHFLGGEAFGSTALAGAAFILCSVVLILRTKRDA